MNGVAEEMEKHNQSKLSSKAVAAIRYSSTSQLKLQYQIAYTEKGTDMMNDGI